MARKKIIYAAIAIVVLGAMMSAGALGAFYRAPKPASADVVAWDKGMDNATNLLLTNCMVTLPSGSSICDGGVQKLRTECDTMFNVPPPSCSDPRINNYLQVRAGYKATHIS